jgi:hypothetical protein
MSDLVGARGAAGVGVPARHPLLQRLPVMIAGYWGTLLRGLLGLSPKRVIGGWRALITLYRPRQGVGVPASHPLFQRLPVIIAGYWGCR